MDESKISVKAYTTLEALMQAEKPALNRVIKKMMATGLFKTNADLAAFVNQNNIIELIDISCDPTLKNVIGGLPWTLFYWVYYIQEEAVS